MSNKIKNMNAQTITDSLHRRADKKLMDHIDDKLMPLFNEAKDEPYREMCRSDPDSWAPFKDNCWIGSAMKEYKDLLFLYLRDKWRNREVEDFIRKVDEVRQLSEGFGD